LECKGRERKRRTGGEGVMNCSKCSNPLKQIAGGINLERGVNVMVLGCLNRDCEFKMVEISREETPINSFEG